MLHTFGYYICIRESLRITAAYLGGARVIEDTRLDGAVK